MPIFASMKAKEFLKTNKSINAKYIAEKMWPTNKTAKSHLSRKLNDGLLWTEKDENEATKHLNELADDIKKAIK